MNCKVNKKQMNNWISKNALLDGETQKRTCYARERERRMAVTKKTWKRRPRSKKRGYQIDEQSNVVKGSSEKNKTIWSTPHTTEEMERRHNC